jgi:hypothetical protein
LTLLSALTLLGALPLLSITRSMLFVVAHSLRALLGPALSSTSEPRQTENSIGSANESPENPLCLKEIGNSLRTASVTVR